MGKRIDMIGQTFGELTVIGYSHTNAHRAIVWDVSCSCGKKTKVIGSDIRNGHTRSCGHIVGSNRKHDDDYLSGLNQLYSSYKSKAKKRGYTFELRIEDFFVLTQTSCYYCDTDPKQKLLIRGTAFIYNGIDRKDNTVGYVKGNVVACCGICNRAKDIMGVQEFYNHIEKMYDTMKVRKDGPIGRIS